MRDVDYYDVMVDLLEKLKYQIFLVKDSRIVFANQAVEILGYRPDELLGKNVLDIVCESDREKFREAIKKLDSERKIDETFVILGKARNHLEKVSLVKDKEVIMVMAVDVSKEESIKKVLKLLKDVKKVLPSCDIEALKRILQSWNAFIGLEKTSGGELEIPITFQNEVFGFLKMSFPNWFVLDDEILEILRILAEDIGKIFVMKRYQKIIDKAIFTLKEAAKDFSVLVDGIRNPLAVIYLHCENLSEKTVQERIKFQVRRIEQLVRKIEKSWKNIEDLEVELENNFKSCI
ncbi:MAG: PAS domain S-box protein [Archaeoglobaceae archaeon]